MDPQRLGRAIIRAYLNISISPATRATVIFDATKRAGGAMDLALRIRRTGRLEGRALVTFGELAGLSAMDLRLWCIPALEAAEMLDATRSESGEILEIEERVGVAEPVLEQAGRIWEHFTPDERERCAIESSDHLAYAPLGESTHRGLLEAAGYAPGLHRPAFTALAAVGLLRRQRSERLNEDVLYSPYVWGTEAVSVAEFLNQLPSNEREALTALHRTVSDHPGTSIETLGSDVRLLSGARKVGLVDATRVVTSGGTEHAFAFSPLLERQLSLGSTDVAHERKLFVSHILNGHRFGNRGTGRIDDPLILVDALIRRGRVGPASAISSDYPLLEARGIVRVVSQPNSKMAFLELVKDDVAKDSLELLRLSLSQTTASSPTAASLRSLWVPGVFTTPEKDRQGLPEIDPSAESELLTSTVEELRTHVAASLRGETWH